MSFSLYFPLLAGTGQRRLVCGDWVLRQASPSSARSWPRWRDRAGAQGRLAQFLPRRDWAAGVCGTVHDLAQALNSSSIRRAASRSFSIGIGMPLIDIAGQLAVGAHGLKVACRSISSHLRCRARANRPSSTQAALRLAIAPTRRADQFSAFEMLANLTLRLTPTVPSTVMFWGKHDCGRPCTKLPRHAPLTDYVSIGARVPSPDLPLLTFPHAEAFETWLADQPRTAGGAWLRFGRPGAPETTLSKSDAIDSALAYGWIDGQLGRVDEHYHKVRFTPRKDRSAWSQVNRERVERLIADGRMKPEGLAEVSAREGRRALGRGVRAPGPRDAGSGPSGGSRCAAKCAPIFRQS